MSGITTHVLDTAKGKPASGMPIRLSILTEQNKTDWREIGDTITNADGRAPDLVKTDTQITAGVYRLVFETEVYFSSLGLKGFYPSVTVVFEITDANQHHHVPLLLSPFGYSTYRGS